MTDSSLLASLHSRTALLNLYQIDKGVDSLELRVWHGLAVVQPKQLTILKYRDSSWQLTRTDYWVSNKSNWPNRDLVMLDSSFTSIQELPANILLVIDSINSFDLRSFPSQHKIPGFRDIVADGMGFTVELATNQYYKAVVYNNPGFYKDSFNQKMTRFLNMLNGVGVNTIY